jgi:hypothetical protein
MAAIPPGTARQRQDLCRRVAGNTGSLMKHDRPIASELWILKNVGSFRSSMGGGIAVVCGYDSEQFESVLGDRACVGAVGGTIYVRGPIKGLTKLAWQLDLDEADQEFLLSNMPVFLEKIGRPQLLAEFTDFSQWKKIVAMSWEERQRSERITLREFRTGKWVEGGIFGDVVTDDYDRVANFVNPGDDRLKIPHWQNKNFGAPCQTACPTGIPTQDRINLLRQVRSLELVLTYSPFPASSQSGLSNPARCLQPSSSIIRWRCRNWADCLGRLPAGESRRPARSPSSVVDRVVFLRPGSWSAGQMSLF